MGAADTIAGPSGLGPSRVDHENLSRLLLAWSGYTSDRAWPMLLIIEAKERPLLAVADILNLSWIESATAALGGRRWLWKSTILKKPTRYVRTG